MDENVQFVAVFLIGAKDPVKEFQERTDYLISKGKLTREDVPKLLDKICKMKGNSGEIGREIRKKLRGK
ncbi:MAG: hypothetical protein ACW98Y_11615 [Candidatus Thorarchaeota archaeon]